MRGPAREHRDWDLIRALALQLGADEAAIGRLALYSTNMDSEDIATLFNWGDCEAVTGLDFQKAYEWGFKTLGTTYLKKIRESGKLRLAQEELFPEEAAHG